MTIKYNKRGLDHAFSKHHITKNIMVSSLAKGIRAKVHDKVNNSIIIFTNTQIAIVIDYSGNLRTSFKYQERYFRSKTTKDIVLK